MRTNFIINPRYKEIKSFLKNIPEIFDNRGEIIHQNRRNTIKVIEYNGLKFNVKKFGKPLFANRLSYTYVRDSKAKRAYEYSFRFNSSGIPTPEGVAYIEQFDGGLITYSYFISLQSELKHVMSELYAKPLNGNEKLFKQFAIFTAKMHDSGINHLDYSLGNILFDLDDNGDFKFEVVDINRVDFENVSQESGCKSFVKLWLEDDIFEYMSGFYAQQREMNFERTKKMVLFFRHKFVIKTNLHKALKNNIKRFKRA